MARRPPKGAILEAVLNERVVIYDVSHLLPTNPRKRIELRNPHKIVRFFLHKSGIPGRAGFAGLLASVKYLVRRKVLGGRNFPGAAYTWWLPRRPDRDQHGRLVIYRCNRDEVRSWHTGGDANDTGVAAVVQGNPSRFKLTWQQKLMLAALLPYVQQRYALSTVQPVSTHSRSKIFGGTGKRVCPGKHAEKWLVDEGWIAP
jgi:hypothetical protein